ncbi:hypothetical protein DB88DRAFT_500781 [Papiliotrema laurentii]|uniref:Uncharacterized protein n=1 Tax=Papiliotrema laurentii TaxID=5418 RepID=A0AAD9CT31_PAPLA|nr:hypothetical protein DB88DRAFT_500781 [Papiliotrema laurentii]
MESEYETAKAEADELKATVKTREIEMGTLRALMKERDDECSQLQRQIQQITTEKDTLSRSLQASVTSGDVANALLKVKEATLAEVKTEREQLQAEIARLSKNLHRKEGHCERLEMEKVQLEDSVKAQSIRIVDANGGMTGLHDELAALQAEKRIYEKKITELQFANMELKKQCNAALQREEDASRADRLQSDLETATQEKAQALGALADAEKRLKESNARLVELAKDAKSMRERFDAGNATKEEQAMYQWIDQVAREKCAEERSSLANRLKKSEHENAKLTATVKQLQAKIQTDSSSSRSGGTRVINDEIQPGTHKKDQLGVQNKKQLEAANLKGIEAQTEVETAGNDEPLQKASTVEVEDGSTSGMSSTMPNKTVQASSSGVNQDVQPVKSGVHKPFKSPISAAFQNSSSKTKPGFETMASGMAGSGHLLLKAPLASSTAKTGAKDTEQNVSRPFRNEESLESPIEQFYETQATQERALLKAPERAAPRAQRTSRKKNVNYVDGILEDLDEDHVADDHRPMSKRKCAAEAHTGTSTLDATEGPFAPAAKKARFSTQIPSSSDGVPDDVSMGKSDDSNAVRVNDEIEEDFEKMEKGKGGSLGDTSKPSASGTRAPPNGTRGVAVGGPKHKKAISSGTKTYVKGKGGKRKEVVQALEDSSELSEEEDVEMSMPPSTQLRSRRTSSRTLR